MGSRTNYYRNVGYAYINPPAHDVLELLGEAGMLAHTSVVVTVTGLQFRVSPPLATTLEALASVLDHAAVAWSDNAMRTIYVSCAR